MAVGKHEAVAVRPKRIFWIVAQEFLPERVSCGRERHRRPRMSGVRLLDAIHRKRADGIDTEQIDLCVGGYSLVTDGHSFPSAIPWAIFVARLLDERPGQFATRTSVHWRSFDFTPGMNV